MIVDIADSILSHPGFEKLEDVSILPEWPTPQYNWEETMRPFNFGIQLVRTKRRIRSFTYGLPLETTTNETSRQHLGELQVPNLTVTFARPSASLFRELSDLTAAHTKHLSIRYIFTNPPVDPSVFICPGLENFEKIEILLHLPRPRRILAAEITGQTLINDPNSPGLLFSSALTTLLEATTDEIRSRYTVYEVKGWDVPGGADRIRRVRVWPQHDMLFEVDESGPELVEKEPERTEPKGKDVVRGESSTGNQSKQWERQTDLKLFGGLIRLSLESKKH